MSEESNRGYTPSNGVPPVPEAPEHARAQVPLAPSYTSPASQQPPAGYQAPTDYGTPEQYQSQPDGTSTPPASPYGYSASQGGYEAPSQYQAPQNSSYYQSPPANPYGGYQGGGPVAVPGSAEANLAMILGLVGIFVLPIVFGPIALWQAKKAKHLGNPATAGTILGWVNIAMGAFGVLFFLFFLFVGATSGGTSI